jgi:DNA-binding CsgD family transcriptional regulator
MAGREQACNELTLESLALCDDPAVSPAVTGRAVLARLLVDRHARPSIEASATRLHPPLPPPSDDLTAQFWRRLLASRLALIDGSVAEAQRRLEVPFEVPRLPDHLRVAVLLERAVHGLVMTDREALRDVALELEAIDAVGERLWVQAVRADLEGDLRRAAGLYRDAGESPCLSQPPTAALALVSAAQLLDYLGDPDVAGELTAVAVRSTQSRRNATPFQGWSPHGTRVGVLLDRLPAAAAPGWAADLRAAFAERAGVAATFAPRVPTARELASVPQPRVTAMLSPREHEVLNELARGSTYSDIAANLYVSENTVKTHISSLYSKLSVGRRSEALAVARTMHLL